MVNYYILFKNFQEKKSHSKEMNHILSRMNLEIFRILIFEEKIILEEPIEVLVFVLTKTELAYC
jgi:hypothetical protein